MITPSSSAPKTTLLALVTLLIAVVQSAWGGDGHNWGYGDHNGPKKWAGTCKSGLFQSPIDLKESVSHPRHFEPLVFFLYDKAANVTMKNNGHTLKLTFEQPCVAQMAGGGLPGAFSLAQIHFHWGSEHTLNGRRYPLEAHFVHYNHKRYDNIGSAVGKEDGLAVLGVFYEETSDDVENGVVDKLLDHLAEVSAEGAEYRIRTQMKAEELFPESTDKFFRYRGSLTTPECNEGVLWTVLEMPVPISMEQVEKFKGLKSKSGQIEENFRPVEPLNGRNLYRRSTHNGAPSSTTSSLSLIAAGFAWYFLLATKLP
ncbi:carbonic anhydrase 2-like [Neocloeon triangulifer]|uniref:carbonic anhydrase 2-like n=1 Tax=Neocloeon triangulifer TaxID=2078957 RepID=UPI00286F815E|nr:carbonic anhydrase 2-like [Neocloeon triangulifer]